MTQFSQYAVACLALSLFACGDDAPALDGGVADGAVADGAAVDGSARDSGRQDAPDGTTLDSAVLDGGVDAGPPITGFFAAPDGTEEGDGSEARPWDFATALGAVAQIMPGDTLWVRAGIYAGEFESLLEGTEDAPIYVRPYPGEHVRIDSVREASDELRSGLTVSGAHTWFFDFEVMSSASTTYRGGEEDRPTPSGGGVLLRGPFVKVIDFVVHNNTMGFSTSVGSTGGLATGAESYGGASFANGFRQFGSSRDHGHGAYYQNVHENEPQRFERVTVFDNFSQSMQCRSSSGAQKVDRFIIAGNFFDGGVGLFEGGGSDPDNLPIDHVFDGNYLHRGTWRFGQSALHAENFARHNTVIGGQLEVHNVLDLVGEGNRFYTLGGSMSWVQYRNRGDVPTLFDDAIALDGNHYFGEPVFGRGTDDWFGGMGTTRMGWDEWRMHNDVTGSRASLPAETLVETHGHAFLPGRAFVVAYRFDETTTSIEVDASEAGLALGEAYEVIFAFDPVRQGDEGVGTRVWVEGHAEGAISIPLEGLMRAGKNGYDTPGVVRAPYDGDFFVFWIRSVASTAAPVRTVGVRTRRPVGPSVGAAHMPDDRGY